MYSHVTNIKHSFCNVVFHSKEYSCHLNSCFEKNFKWLDWLGFHFRGIPNENVAVGIVFLFTYSTIQLSMFGEENGKE